MVWSICKKELRLNFLNLRFPLLLILSVCFALITAVVSCAHYRKRVSDYLTRREYHKITWDAIYVDRPPQALTIFSNGVFRKSPVSIETRKRPGFGETQHKLIERPTDNILFAGIQYPDISFVVATIVGLGAILFGYDSICGEKERGTLKLALSNNIPRYKVLLGKFLGSAACLWVTVLIVWVVSTGVVLSEPSIHLSVKELSFLALSCLVSLACVTSFIAIVMLVSSVFASSGASLAISVAFWVMVSLLGPPLGPLTAKMVRKVPPYQELISSKQALLTMLANGLNEEWKVKAKDAKNVDEARKIFNRVVWGQGTLRWQKANEKLTSEYQHKVARQEDLSHFLCSISPPLSLQFAISELCGTSLASQRYFEHQALGWARTTISNKKIDYKTPVAQPVIRSLSANARLKHCCSYLAYTLILAMLCFATTFVRFVRCDVR